MTGITDADASASGSKYEYRYSDYTQHVIDQPVTSTPTFMGYPSLADITIPTVPEVKPYVSPYKEAAPSFAREQSCVVPSYNASAPPVIPGDFVPLPADWRPSNATAMIPFSKTEKDCESIFYEWVSSLYLAPTGFKKAAQPTFKRYYAPFLCGSLTATVSYQAQIGRHQHNHHTHHEELLWDVQNGYQIIPFPEISMCSDSSLETRTMVEHLSSWDISPKSITYNSLEVLQNTGYAIGNSVPLEEMWGKYTEPHIKRLAQDRCHRQLEEQKGRYIKEFTLNRLEYQNANTFIIFLPVFMGTYYSEHQAFQFIVNGQNGTYYAERPPYGAGKFGDVMKGVGNWFGYVTGAKNEQVILLSGKELLQKDNHRVYDEHSYYLVFSRSDPMAVGFITITNNGSYPIEVQAQKRRGVAKGCVVTIPARSTETYDYKGHWCLQIVRGNPKDVTVDRVETRGGGTLGDKLEILNK